MKKSNDAYLCRRNMTLSAKERRSIYMKEYNSRPEVKEKKKKNQQEYRHSGRYDWRKYYYKHKKTNPENYLLKQAKLRAKERGLDFDLNLIDIVIPELCPIMKKKLEYIIGTYNDYSPSIDRIDSTKGYVKDNIWVISTIANRMKWNANKEQIIMFANGILEHVDKL